MAVYTKSGLVIALYPVPVSILTFIFDLPFKGKSKFEIGTGYETSLVDQFLAFVEAYMRNRSATFRIVQEAFDKCDISHTGTLLPKVSQPLSTAQGACFCVWCPWVVASVDGFDM